MPVITEHHNHKTVVKLATPSGTYSLSFSTVGGTREQPIMVDANMTHGLTVTPRTIRSLALALLDLADEFCEGCCADDNTKEN